MKTTTRTTTRIEPARARLRARTDAVNQALTRALARQAGSPPVLAQAMRYCVLAGGKRFRPLLCLGAYEAVGRAAAASRHSLGSRDGAASVGGRRGALNVACAIELIHAYSLVHDDLPAMDNADERRGRPSCHRRFGEATAILVGDALLTRAFEVLGSNGVPNTLKILREIAEASGTSGLIGGQALDLNGGSAGAKQLEEIARRKTAALITVSVVAGGLAGGASPSQLKRLEAYGRRIGLAFQLIDDVHDADGLARALGVARVRARAARLIGDAKRQLQPFGSRAQLLIDLADWLAGTR